MKEATSKLPILIIFSLITLLITLSLSSASPTLSVVPSKTQIDISPSSLSFGTISPGNSSDPISITFDPGSSTQTNNPIDVSISISEGIFRDNLKINLTNNYTQAHNQQFTIQTETPKLLDIILDLPAGTPAGPINGTITYTLTAKILEPGDNFTVDIDILNAKDLYGMQFDLLFNNNSINFTGISPGPFLQIGAPIFAIGPTSNHSGILDNYGTTRFGQGIGGVSGNGTLAKINFLALTSGVSDLNLSETLLSTILPNSTIIDTIHSTQNSSVAIF
jgi:hypothetical protein